jgi:hypothetical protein
MNTPKAWRTGLALAIFIIGSLQAWDSHVGELRGVVGLFIVLLVSIAIAVPAVTLLTSRKQTHAVAAFVLSFVLLVVARLVSPLPLPELLLILLPVGIAMIYVMAFEPKLA